MRNVLGYLPGRSKEYIIIGAHYDHLGSAARVLSRLHRWARFIRARMITHREPRVFSSLRGCLLAGAMNWREAFFYRFRGRGDRAAGFVALGESSDAAARERRIAMINMDMIGRVNGSKLYIGGTGTGSTFRTDAEGDSRAVSIQDRLSADGYSSSDHTSFVAKSIPVLFFFSGLHGDYHKPSDTWERLTVPRRPRS